MVHGQQQHVLAARQPQQAARSSGPVRQVEGTQRLLARPARRASASRCGRRAGRCRSTVGSGKAARAAMSWTGCAVAGEGGAQGLVAAHELVEARAAARRRPARPQPHGRRACCRRRCRARAGRGTTGAAGRRTGAARPSRGTGRAAAASARAARRRSGRRCARRARRGWAPRRGRAGAAPRSKAERMRETTCVASSEWPPSSKKLSLAPTRATPSTSAQRRGELLLGGRARGDVGLGVGGVASGAGRALRSTLPLAVRGRASSAHEGRGHHVLGQALLEEGAQRRRCRAGAECRRRRPTRRLSPGTSSRATTTASRTPGCARSAASISPSSMRKPRSFTWESARPRNSSVAVGAASAPGRRCGTGARRASALKGSGTKRSAVSSGRLQVAAGQAVAADVQLAGHADGHGLQVRVQHVHLGVGDGAADGHGVPHLLGAASRAAGGEDGALGGAVARW